MFHVEQFDRDVILFHVEHPLLHRDAQASTLIEFPPFV